MIRQLTIAALMLLSGLVSAQESRHSGRTAQTAQWALKTNLLSDAALTPSIGAELVIAGRWSLSGDWQYAWWKNDRRHFHHQIYGGSLVARRWLGRNAGQKVLRGHHLGLYGQMFSYDFERGEHGEMGALPGGTLWDRCNWGFGLEYGWAFPVSRKLNLDFSLGMGFTGGKYESYQPVDDHHVWNESSRRRWLGPGRAEISLVWLMGKDNFNDRRARR